MGVPQVALESKIQKRIRRALDARCWVTVKYNPDAFNGAAGFPDLICIGPGGKVVFLEVKKPGENPSAIQRWWHGQLRTLGHRVAVVTSETQAVQACTE